MSWNLGVQPPTLSDFSSDPFFYNSIYTSPTTLLPSLNCFLQGTKILTSSRGYIPIENLIEGELLKTTNGETTLKKKLYRTIIATQENLPYLIPHNFYSQQLPSENTYLSPLHCLFHNGDWFCMCQSNFQQDTSFLNQKITYYHLITNDYNKDFIYCNGLISETLKPCEENYQLYKECIDSQIYQTN